MEDILVPIALFIAFFGTIVAITKTISDNRTKRRLIDAGVSEEFVEALFTQRRDPDTWTALKWGLVVVGLGLALVIVQFLPYDFEEPIAYGLMFLFGGGGLLLYHVLTPYGPWSPRQQHPEV